jgi:hypothetical protein
MPRNSPSVLEKLSSGAKKIASNGKKYLQKTAFVTALTIGGCGTDYSFIPPQPAPPTNSGNSESRDKTIQSVKINSDPSEKKLAEFYASDGGRLKLWGDRSLDGEITRVSEIKYTSPEGRSMVIVRDEETGFPMYAKTEEGISFEVNGYDTSDRMDISYSSSDGRTGRAIIDFTKSYNQKRTPSRDKSDISARSSCNDFNILRAHACDAKEVVDQVFTVACVAGGVVDLLGGSGIGTLVGCGGGYLASKGFNRAFCDSSQHCNDINVSFVDLAEELPPQISHIIVEEDPGNLDPPNNGGNNGNNGGNNGQIEDAGGSQSSARQVSLRSEGKTKITDDYFPGDKDYFSFNLNANEGIRVTIDYDEPRACIHSRWFENSRGERPYFISLGNTFLCGSQEKGTYYFVSEHYDGGHVGGFNCKGSRTLSFEKS